MVERFQIRDIETKEILIRNSKKIIFRSDVAARIYLLSMNFKLNDYYEIYDSLNDCIVEFIGKSRTQKIKHENSKMTGFWQKSK